MLITIVSPSLRTRHPHRLDAAAAASALLGASEQEQWPYSPLPTHTPLSRLHYRLGQHVTRLLMLPAASDISRLSVQ